MQKSKLFKQSKIQEIYKKKNNPKTTRDLNKFIRKLIYKFMYELYILVKFEHIFHTNKLLYNLIPI